MRKIPPLFNRGPDGKATDSVTPGCEWVTDEGVATEKLDGANVRLTVRSGQIVRVEKRRNPAKALKASGIVDPWYVDVCRDDAADQWAMDAAANTDASEWPDGEHCCEAIGPKIQGNPLGLGHRRCVPFDLKPHVYARVVNGGVGFFPGFCRTYDYLRGFLDRLDSLYAPGHLAEGIVFHHPDGRRAKIRRKDFGFRS